MTCSLDPTRPQDGHSFFVGSYGEHICRKCGKTTTMISLIELNKEIQILKGHLDYLQTYLELPPLGTLPPPKDPVKELEDHRTKQAAKAVEQLVEERRKLEEMYYE